MGLINTTALMLNLMLCTDNHLPSSVLLLLEHTAIKPSMCKCIDKMGDASGINVQDENSE